MCMFQDSRSKLRCYSQLGTGQGFIRDYFINLERNSILVKFVIKMG